MPVRSIRIQLSKPLVVKMHAYGSEFQIIGLAEHRTLKRNWLIVLAPVKHHFSSNTLEIKIFTASNGVEVTLQPLIAPRRIRLISGIIVLHIAPARASSLFDIGIELREKLRWTKRSKVLNESRPNMTVGRNDDERFHFVDHALWLLTETISPVM